MTDTCEVLGRMSNTEIKYIDNSDKDKGIKITYNKGIFLFKLFYKGYLFLKNFIYNFYILYSFDISYRLQIYSLI